MRDFAVCRFKDGKVVEISTRQDQFSLLKQIGYLPEGVHPAHYLIAPRWASRLEPVDLAERTLSCSVPIALDVAMPARPPLRRRLCAAAAVSISPRHLPGCDDAGMIL